MDPRRSFIDTSTKHRMQLARQSQVLLEVMATARFPIWGLVGNPDGLTVQSLGYCAENSGIGQATSIQQIAFSYAYPPSAGRETYRLELVTTSPGPSTSLTLERLDICTSQSAQVSNLYDIPHKHYDSLEEVPRELPGSEGFATIARFPCMDGDALAMIHYWCCPKIQCNFVLSAPGKRLDCKSYGWTYRETLTFLQCVANVAERSEVIDQYSRELSAWIL